MNHDPVFLAKLDRFLAALGRRYDGNPNVAFVDVGMLGIWGEGHPIAHNYGFETVKRHMDMHRKHFPHTLLAADDDFDNNFVDDDLARSRRVVVPRIGYRLNLIEASWPRIAPRTEALSLSAAWSNVGVAPCYPDANPAWWLVGARGEILAVLVDEDFSMRELPVAPPEKAQATTRARAFLLPPDLAKGEYELRASVGDRDGTPRIALPLPGNDGHRRYRLGKIQLE